MDVESVRKMLIEMADEDYRKFHSKLVPGTENILGVRVPELRKLAKKLVKENWREYFEAAPDMYYEEDMLRGFMIGYGKMDLEERLERIREFLPSIHNWGGLRLLLFYFEIYGKESRNSLGIFTALLYLG